MNSERIEKLNTLQSLGMEVYPDHFETTAELHEAAILEDGTSGVRVAGRITGIRSFRKHLLLQCFRFKGISLISQMNGKLSPLES